MGQEISRIDEGFYICGVDALSHERLSGLGIKYILNVVGICRDICSCTCVVFPPPLPRPPTTYTHPPASTLADPPLGLVVSCVE